MVPTLSLFAQLQSYINTSAKAPPKGQKKWVKQQGLNLKSNQGSEVQLKRMHHSLHKECSALLYETVQARIEDNDPGFESDHWMKRGKIHQDMDERHHEPTRADQWFYQKMDE
jgi:hypothetical protein